MRGSATATIVAGAAADASAYYSGTCWLCSHDYYRGDCREFSPGRYDNLGGFGDRVASAELIATTPGPVGLVAPPAPSGRVALYELPRFGGRSLVIDQLALPNLESLGFDAASMRIEAGYWMFCTDVWFQGDCRTLGPGEYARLPGDVEAGSPRRAAWMTSTAQPGLHSSTTVSLSTKRGCAMCGSARRLLRRAPLLEAHHFRRTRALTRRYPRVPGADLDCLRDQTLVGGCAQSNGSPPSDIRTAGSDVPSLMPSPRLACLAAGA